MSNKEIGKFAGTFLMAGVVLSFAFTCIGFITAVRWLWALVP